MVKKYLSHDIVNECISLLGNTLLRELLCSIRETSIFSIMADETRDISNQEQLSICIRWIDSEFQSMKISLEWSMLKKN